MIDKKYLDDIRAIHPKLFSKIRKAGTKTGSKVFGGWKEGSDIDFIMPPGFSPDFSESLANRILAYNTKEYREDGWGGRTYVTGYMKTEAGTIINLLWMETEDAYRQWIEATEILKNLVQTNPTIAEAMQDKKRRVSFFEALKEVLE